MEQDTQNDEMEWTIEDKQWALISYLVPPLTGLMVLLIEEKAKRATLKVHALLSIILGSIGVVLFCVYPLVWLYSIYLGLMAYQGKPVSVPYLSDWIVEQGWVDADSANS